jgi:hypothetical protein
MDQGAEDDVARHLIQPSGTGSGTGIRRAGPGPRAGQSPTRRPDCSHSGRTIAIFTETIERLRLR